MNGLAGEPSPRRVALLSELPTGRLNQPDGELPAPHSFSATVVARLTKLSVDAQDLVTAAAVAGQRCELAFAAAVAGIADPLPAVEEALGADLLSLVPTRLPQEVEFAHPLMRAAVYDDLSVTRRRALHLACGELSAEPASLAHRVAASDGADDELAAELRTTAEAEIAAFRLTAGIERLMWTSRIAADAVARDRALLRAVECQVLAGDIPGANNRLDAVLACSDSPRRTFTIGVLTAAAGRVSEAEASFREVIASPDYRNDPELAGPVTSTLALVCALQGRAQDAIEWSRRALDVPGAPPTAQMTARSALGFGLMLTGHGDEAIDSLAFLSPSAIDPDPLDAELLASRGSFKIWWGDVTGAQEDASAVAGWSRAGMPVRSLPNAYGALAEAEFYLGRWDDGLAHAEVAISVSEDAGRAWDRSYVHAVAAYLLSARGNSDAASEHVAAARRAAEAAPIPRCIYYACAAAGYLAWVRADWEAVLRELAPLQMLLSEGNAAGMGKRWMQAIAAEAMLMTGQLDDAEQLVGLIAAELDESLPDFTRIERWRLRGLIDQARKRPEAAEAAFDRGRQAADSLEAPLAEGLLELSCGQFMRRRGSRRAAIAMLRVAADRFGALKAQPFQVRCESELTACGVRASERTSDNRYGLTAREDLVARLVASGKSNREVADELFLSTKAIEYHLGNVFAKVNIRSRHDLAGRLGAKAQ